MTEQFISYYELNDQLKQAEIALSSAEIHGFLSGLVCGGLQDQSWQPLLFQFTNENHAYPTALLQQISQIYQEINQTLADVDGFNFELWLPEDEDVFARADALSDWTNHFLLGLGLTRPNLDQETDEIREGLEDLQNIAQLGYDEDEDQEELAEALEEIVEYVRTVATLFYTHFYATSSKQKPVFH